MKLTLSMKQAYGCKKEFRHHSYGDELKVVKGKGEHGYVQTQPEQRKLKREAVWIAITKKIPRDTSREN